MSFALLAALSTAAALAALHRRRRARALWAGPDAGFLAFQQHLAGGTGLAVNPEADVLCLARVGHPARHLGPEQVIGVEVVEDGAVVMRRDRASGWDAWDRDEDLGARHTRVARLELRIAVEDAAGPVHVVSFLPRAATKDSPAYRRALAEIEHWFGVVATLLARAPPPVA